MSENLIISFIGNIISVDTVYSILIKNGKDNKAIKIIEDKPRKINKKVQSSIERVLITYKCRLTGEEKKIDVPISIGKEILNMYDDKVFEISTKKKKTIVERFENSLIERTIKIPTIGDFCWHVCIIGQGMQTRYIVTIIGD